jgi:hypothetical protein
VQKGYEQTLEEIKNFTHRTGNPQKLSKELRQELKFILELPLLSQKYKGKSPKNFMTAFKTGMLPLTKKESNWYLIFSWLFVHRMGAVVDPESSSEQSRVGLDEWLISRLLDHLFSKLGFSDEEKTRNLSLLKLLTTHQQWWILKNKKKSISLTIMQNLLKDPDVRNYLRINRYHDILWYTKEAFNELMSWLMLMVIIGESPLIIKEEKKYIELIVSEHKKISQLKNAHKKSEFQINKLLDALKK